MALIKNPKYQFVFFLVLFFAVNLLQSAYTGLFEDEAYYWVWSKNLAWGYFDHPPMVALFIWIGGLFFDGELGVRLLSIVSFTFMLVFIWKTLDYKNKKEHVTLFFILIISLALIQVFGFVSTPDTPLMLFTSVFFLVYKRFLNKNNLVNSAFMGISMAALMYSKYHGILVIGFVVLSNLSLLKNKYFWQACAFSIMLYIPHLWWQYENGFPSFIYHLKERGHHSYHLGHSLNHILNIMVVCGITFPVIYMAFLKKKASNQLEKSFKFVVWGFLIFFFFSSFKASPQAQWLAAMLIPLCLISFPYIAEHPKLRKWLTRLGLAQLFIVLIARVWLAIPALSPIVLETHLAQSWIAEAKANTEGKPLVFINSYRNASMYTFHTGIETHSYGIPRGRKSQYDLLDTESKLQGKAVFGVGRQLEGNTFVASKGDTDLYGLSIESLNTFQQVRCEIIVDEIDMSISDNNPIRFNIINPYDKSINFENAQFFGIFQNKKNEVLKQVELEFDGLTTMDPKQEITVDTVIQAPILEIEDTISFRIGISFHKLPPGLQGNKVTVKVKTTKS